eukprot:CAMPEP_0198733900 /NCGR_PEP_ID=MMETSP1475-20131203/49063_1 /TAXON_ID= ORGANISM="Unidentified sp., Strain CCMP1999" /NCGR_SAMPLE_ID=MMETSP1475 /ASSEMBLY_ACC=CAM_ASM_001111 /LENGTH=156 /DNA_ID=CAMNT_0044497273 /DNA_START=140 /DNA_END=610 /DNA_ORIENTATION=-
MKKVRMRPDRKPWNGLCGSSGSSGKTSGKASGKTSGKTLGTTASGLLPCDSLGLIGCKPIKPQKSKPGFSSSSSSSCTGGSAYGWGDGDGDDDGNGIRRLTSESANAFCRTASKSTGTSSLLELPTYRENRTGAHEATATSTKKTKIAGFIAGGGL